MRGEQRATSADNQNWLNISLLGVVIGRYVLHATVSLIELADVMQWLVSAAASTV